VPRSDGGFSAEEESMIHVLQFGLGRGNQFQNFSLFLIHLWTVSFVERHRRSAGRRLRLARQVSGVYQGAYRWSGRRRVHAYVRAVRSGVVM